LTATAQNTGVGLQRRHLGIFSQKSIFFQNLSGSRVWNASHIFRWRMQ